MKTEPWKLASQIVAESAVLEDLLVKQARLEMEIVNERRIIATRITKALEAFALEAADAS